jgi:c-di-GMP-binding flagellar brake protein YcgR
MPGPVLEKRSFPRVNLAADGLLVYRDALYRARLENISLAGALVSFDGEDEPAIGPGERCQLALYRDGNNTSLRFSTRVVHLGYGMASVRFVNLDEATRLKLRSLIAHQLPEPRHIAPRTARCRG